MCSRIIRQGVFFVCIFSGPDKVRSELRTEKQNRERENEYLEERCSIRHRALMTHQILKKCLLEP